MSAHVGESLPEWALGLLAREEHELVERHLSTCPRCAAEAASYGEATAGLATSLRPKAPSPSIRGRLLAAAEAKGRLAQYEQALASFFEISTDKARSLLDAVDAPEAWEHDSGIGLIHLAPGPALARLGVDAGLVRFPAGMHWGLHRHVGDERHLFLEGAICEDGTGRTFRAGDKMINAAGTEHSFQILPETDCVAAVILMAGIEMPPGTKVSFG